MLILSDQNFEEEIQKSALPMIIDFWASWCAPCKLLHPVLEELEKELDGKVVVAKIDIDTSPKIAEDYAVISIPLILFVKDSKTVGRHVGLLTKKQFLEKIATHLI